MAIIAQKRLFSWKEIEASSDLDRLRLVLSTLPDEKLMVRLEKLRKKKRDDYPIRAIWNSIIAGIVYQHPSIESLRRELLRNGELRDLCGFEAILGDRAVPTKYVYSRFLKKLLDMREEINKIFHSLIKELEEFLPDLGEHLAVDGKAIESYAKGKKNSEQSSDPDADWGVKKYRGKRADGTYWEKVKNWFGYNLHLVVDANYELPLGYKVTKASVNDGPELLPLIKVLKEKHPDIAGRAKYCSADKGYDSEENNRKLYDEYEIKPIIDIRDMWKDEKKSEIKTRPLYEDRVDNIVYDSKGNIYCYMGKEDRVEEERTRMAFAGFEEARKCLKYRCPAAAYGVKCGREKSCGGGKYSGHGRVVRIPLERDRRMFTPVARSSYKFKKLKKKRSSVERVNSRIDQVYGFERHFIRRKKKMEVRVGLALVVMLAMSLGRIKQKEKEKLRSLVKPVLQVA